MLVNLERMRNPLDEQIEILEYGAYPEAACRPKPRDPPVTTTTFPLREKMLGKSWSSVSYFDILAELGSS